MSLHVYTDKKYLPEDMKYIDDVEGLFGAEVLKPNEYTARVLRDVEQATFCKDSRGIRSNMFTDRFGGALYLGCLSTTSKILLAVAYHPNRIFNGAELGKNGVEFLLEIPEGHIYYPNSLMNLPEYARPCTDIYVNNHLCSSVFEANERIGGSYADL